MKKTCPCCNKTFTRRKKIEGQMCCPNCAQPLYCPSNGKVYTQAEKEAVDSLVKLLEELISARDGVRFEFDLPGQQRERVILYLIITRSRSYLSKVPDDFGWTSASFTIELAESIVEGWAAAWIESYAQINSHVSKAAHDLYRSRKVQAQVEANQHHIFVDLMSYTTGGTNAYVAGTGLD
jgi:hypothetical protein